MNKWNSISIVLARFARIFNIHLLSEISQRRRNISRTVNFKCQEEPSARLHHLPRIVASLMLMLPQARTLTQL
jgi:hypothetical protein